MLTYICVGLRKIKVSDGFRKFQMVSRGKIFRQFGTVFFIFLIIICISRFFLLTLHSINNTNHKHNFYHYEVHDKESSCHGLQPQPQLQWCDAHTEQMDRQMRCVEDTTLSARVHKHITKPHSRTGEPHLRVSWRAVKSTKIHFTFYILHQNE